MTSKPFPPPGGMPSFWRSELGPLDDHRTTESLPTECDILIVGAGYSGGSLVTHLLEQEEARSKSIVVLEARSLCSGATGRNGGHLKPDVYNLASSVAEKAGVEAGSEIAEFELANFEAVSKYIDDTGAYCDFEVTQAVDVQLSEGHNTALKARYDRFISSGAKTAKTARYSHGREAEVISGVKGAHGAYRYPTAHLWPYKLIHHMFTRALSSHPGLNLQTHTPATSISPTPNSDSTRTITTPRGSIRAKQVIIATNAYTSSLLPSYASKIIPYRTICSRIVVPSPSLPPLLPNSYALRFNEWDYDYLIPRNDGSIVVGGARRMYLKDLDMWYGNVDDTATNDDMVERGNRYFDGYMQRNFRGWENSGAKTSDVWTGVMGYSSDRLPRIGAIPNTPDSQNDNMYIMAGFTGHGMPQIFLAAKGIAEMVVKGKSYEDTGMPRLFKETRERLESKEDFAMDLHRTVLRGEAGGERAKL